jgi:predicted Zn-dependent peptidase
MKRDEYTKGKYLLIYDDTPEESEAELKDYITAREKLMKRPCTEQEIKKIKRRLKRRKDGDEWPSIK